MKPSFFPLTLAVGFSAVACVYANPGRYAAEFEWESIIPSHDLEYHGCYEDFKSARLILPMDWLDESNKETVTIAIAKLPAVVDDDDASFGGTIFAQPGGPAVSGTYFGRNRAHRLRDLIDIPGKRRYEILSFDARGVGHSSPRINCFPGVLSNMWALETGTNGALDLSPAALAFGIAAAKADAHKCEKTHGNFLSYVGTPNVARDIVAMIDKIDDLRRANSKPSKHSESEGPDGLARVELRSTSTRNVHRDEVSRLQYIGVSYGTVVGNYFASMFPGRVGRMVLDGVMDVNDSADGVGWHTNTVDTDEIVDNFFRGCFAAGQSGCALHRETDSSESDISDRFWSWANSLDEHPLLITTEAGDRTSIRSGDIRCLFLWAMYNAVYDSKPLAVSFNDAMQGNTTSLLERHIEFSMTAPLQSTCSNHSSIPVIAVDARTAIICVDGDDVSNYNNSDWHAYLQKQLSISSVGGAFWTTIRLACAGWRTRPNWLFRGPFTTPHPSKSAKFPKPGHPAAPLLFISNQYDPVTPVQNARAMAKSHPGAGILVQKSTGHCVTLGPMGACVKKVISEYFDTGVVAAKETSCEAVRGPWETEKATDRQKYEYSFK